MTSDKDLKVFAKAYVACVRVCGVTATSVELNKELANIAKKKDEANEMLKGKGANFTWKLQELGTYHEDLQTIEDVRNRCEGATAYYKRLLASSIWDKICKDNNGEFKMEEVRVMLAGAKDSAEMES